MTDRGHVTIAGIGPGASDSLLTQEVGRLLREADLVIYEGSMLSSSLRGLVRGELLFGTIFDGDIIRDRVLSAVENGKHVAWLVSGDPSLYSGEPGRFGSIGENTAWLRAQGIDYKVLPGVSSLHALTARLGLEHSGPASGTPLVIYAPGRDSFELAEERLRVLCAHRFPMALFLGIEQLQQIVSIAIQFYGPDARIIIGYKVGWPDERIIDSKLANVLNTTDERELSRHALVLLGPWYG